MNFYLQHFWGLKGFMTLKIGDLAPLRLPS